MATGFLQIPGDKVVVMENFITGYPGHESEHREAMRTVLGNKKYEFFFNKFLEHFFTDADAQLAASLGLTCLRLPFNYRHFEDDTNPRVLKPQGVKALRPGHRTLPPPPHLHHPTPARPPQQPKPQLALRHPRLAHAPSGTTWTTRTAASGSGPRSRRATPASRESQATIPSTSTSNAIHFRLPAFYARLEPVIHAVDSKHILWLDGSTFAMKWKLFEPLVSGRRGCGIECLVCMFIRVWGFRAGRRSWGLRGGRRNWRGSFWGGQGFMHVNKVPAWNGEFGPVYEDPRYAGRERAGVVNAQRYGLLGEKLWIYERYGISWNIWLYKDIGLPGMVSVDPESRYLSTIEPVLEKKRVAQ